MLHVKLLFYLLFILSIKFSWPLSWSYLIGSKKTRRFEKNNLAFPKCTRRDCLDVKKKKPRGYVRNAGGIAFFFGFGTGHKRVKQGHGQETPRSCVPFQKVLFLHRYESILKSSPLPAPVRVCFLVEPHSKKQCFLIVINQYQLALLSTLLSLRQSCSVNTFRRVS